MRLRAILSSVVLLAGCLLLPDDEPGALTRGRLSADDEIDVLEGVIRYGTARAQPPCANYGSKAASCLSVGTSEEPPPKLLKRLADVRPPIRSLAECRRAGIVGPQVGSVDPTITVEWLEIVSNDALRARIVVSCSVSEPTVRRTGGTWSVEPSGWLGSCPTPVDCIFQPLR